MRTDVRTRDRHSSNGRFARPGRAKPRANVDRLQATPSDARRLSSLVKCPLSDTEPTAEPGKPVSQGVKDHLATSDLHGDPDNRRTGRRQPRPHRLTASRSLTVLQQLHDAGAGLGAQTKPAHTALAATAAGARELHSDEPPRR